MTRNQPIELGGHLVTHIAHLFHITGRRGALGLRRHNTGVQSREAGLALNDLEAALSRALQQPRAGSHPEVESALVADATLRRISARLIVLRHAPEAAAPEAEPWRAWITATLAALGADRPVPERPALDRGQSLVRLVSQVDLLVGTLRPGEIRAGTAAVGAVPGPANGATSQPVPHA